MRKLQPNLRGASGKVARMLQTIIALELLQPSQRIYLNVVEINDNLILPNSAGEFSGIIPDMKLETLSLSEIFKLLVASGTHIYILLRNPPSNILLGKLHHNQIHIEISQKITPPGWIGDKYFLSGTLSFLRDQIDVGDREIVLETEELEVDKMIAEAVVNWTSNG